jgi:NADPH-dependent ferric siderophore reductase
MTNTATDGNDVPRRPTARDTAALLERLGEGVSLWDLEVIGAWAINATMRRLRCTAPALAGLSYQPGQDLMMTMLGTGEHVVRRRYTIRSFDEESATIDIDMVLHGDGPGATWAAAVRPGAHIEAIGPRGKVTLDPSADWHLFAGDDSAIPASLAMVESLPTPDGAVVILEVDDAANEQRARALDGREIAVRWLHRDGADPASSANFVAALQSIEFLPGHGHAYLAGELGVVADMQRTLLARGFTAEQISAKPYWRAAVANAPHGEPERP